MSAAPYFLFSKLPGEPNAGIWLAEVTGPRQPVRLAVDLVEWVATPKIVGGGPTVLAVGPYAYTTEIEGEVIATNDRATPRDWFLIPSNRYEQYYLIAADPEGRWVWTAREPRQPIRIEPLEEGSDRQQWTFKPILRE